MDIFIIVISLITLLAGLGLGFMFGRFNGASAQENRRLAAELGQTKEEMGQYRAQVQAHFEKTAELINGMTESYKAVYEHLAASSQSLCHDHVTKLDKGPVEPLLINVAGDEAETAGEESKTEEAERAEAEMTAEQLPEEAVMKPAEQEPATSERVH